MNDIENIVKPKDMQMDKNYQIYKEIVDEMIKHNMMSKKDMQRFLLSMKQAYSINFANNEILYTYKCMCQSGEIDKSNMHLYEELLQTKTFRSQSGVMVYSIVTSPYPNGQAFSCEYDCKYCPKEPNQPRSYNPKEPGVARANAHNFDPVMQFRERANTYVICGHPFDKAEVIVLGGTWSSYPVDYQHDLIRDIYYAANTYCDSPDVNMLRPRLTLEQEILLNETSLCRIIGLTLETRPDRINPKELVQYRKYGVTRVQMGVQHTNNRILERVDRRCTTQHTVNAIQMLKDNCFKVDIHLMPDLPQPYKLGVSVNDPDITKDDIDTSVNMAEEDKKMFDIVNDDPWFQADQWKIYPCEVVPWTDIETEYKNGWYKPYGEQVGREFTELHEVIIYIKSKIRKSIRLNRIIRDIPHDDIIGGLKDVGMRQTIQNEMMKRGLTCKCIRCREVKKQNIDPKSAVLMEYVYEASGGMEYFISFETPDESVLFGFLRLRLCNNAGKNNSGNNVIFPELVNSALIRELHVYGQTTAVKRNDETCNTHHQHVGFGTKLLQRAFHIASSQGYKKIAVISGVGVKKYYEKFGFADENLFMTKSLE